MGQIQFHNVLFVVQCTCTGMSTVLYERPWITSLLPLPLVSMACCSENIYSWDQFTIFKSCKVYGTITHHAIISLFFCQVFIKKPEWQSSTSTVAWFKNICFLAISNYGFRGPLNTSFELARFCLPTSASSILLSNLRSVFLHAFSRNL